MIKELCPTGVIYKSLGELGKFYSGLTGKSKNDFTNGNAKFITYKNVYSNPALDINVGDRVKIAPDEKQRILEYGDVIFTGSSETPDECGISSVLTVKTDEELYLNSFCFVFRFNDPTLLLPDFCKHLFRAPEVRYQIGKTANGVTRFNVSKKLMENVMIPLPPIEVQREIVRILDNFTELTAELTAELTVRNKQFEYYRTQLLTFPDEEEMVTLEEVCQIVDCPHTSPKWKESGVPVIRNYNLVNGQIDTSNLSYVDEAEYLTRIKRIEPQENDILFSREAPIGNVGIIPANFKCCQGQRVVLLRPNQDIIFPRYLMHILQGEIVRNQISSVEGKGATVSNFNISDLRKLKFQVPDKKMQLFIIEKLDVFVKLNGDIKEGLPAEIALRKKQYEYYREKLLSFPERSQA